MFREMRYVYAVYQARSFSRAAQQLFISQPSLSIMIKRAEQKVGGPIFDRSTVPIRLTPIGREYINAAERLMEIENAFERQVNDINQCLTGSLALGGTTLFTSYILPPLISAFSEKYPGVDIRLQETHTVALEKMLIEGTLDLVVENYSFNPDVYERSLFCVEHMLLAVPAAFAINERLRPYRLSAQDVHTGVHLLETVPVVPLAQFSSEQFLLLKEGNDTRARADRMFARAHIRPYTRLLLDQQITSYNLVCYGMGLAFVSDTLIRHVPAFHDVWFYKLDADLAQRDVCFYYKRSRHLTSAMKRFMQDVQETAKRAPSIAQS